MPCSMHYRPVFLFLLCLFPSVVFSQSIEIHGIVTDSDGNGIEKVNVFEFNTSIGTSTDENGNYRLALKDNRRPASIIFSHVSFRNDTIILPENIEGSYQLNRTLIPKYLRLNEIEIASDQLREDRKSAGLFQINPATSREVVSPFSDFNSVLFTLPGVVSVSELSSSYNVRGGNFDENLVFVNGMPIYRPNLVRSGQQEGLSFVNPDLVQDITFYAGGWGPGYGDRMSSVLDIQYKKPENFGGSVELSLLGGSAHLEGSINENLNYAIGLRHKNSKYLVNTLEVNGQYFPNFSDVQGLVNYRLNSSTEIGVLFNYASNNYEVVPESQQTDFGTYELPLRLFVAFDGIEKLVYRTWQSGIFIEKQLGKLKNKTIVSGYTSFEREYFEIEGFYRLCVVQNDISKENFDECLINRGIGSNYRSGRNFFDIAGATIENKNEISINAIHKVEFGAGYTYQDFKDKNKEYYLVDSTGFVSVIDKINSKNKLQTNQVFLFGSHDYQISPRHNLSYGFRLNYHDITGELLINPRLQYSYKSPGQKNIIYRFATGLYHQPPFYREYKDKKGVFNKDIKSQKSAHFIAGFDWEFNLWDRPFKFTGEGFYKSMWDAIPYDIDNVKIRYYGKNISNAYAAGVDFRLSGEFIEGNQSWFSLGLLQTKENIKNDGLGYVQRPTNQLVNMAIFFQDHVPNLPSYKVNVTLFYNSPLPFYPPNSDRSSYFKGEKYQRLDIGFSKYFKMKNNQRITFGIEILNLTNNANVISYSWIQDISGNFFAVPNTLSARYLNVRLRYDW